MIPDIRELSEISDLEKLSLQNYSYSRLSAFDWCQAQFFYSYVLKMPKDYGAKAMLGNVLHRALELCIRNGEKIDRAELFETYQGAREEYDPEDQVITDELYEEGIVMLENFLELEANKVSDITEAELGFEFVFHGTLVRGYIDQVFVKKDTVRIVDFKSGAYEVSNKNLPFDLQLGIYALYAKHIYPDKTITASLHYLRSEKVKTHTFTDEELIEVEDRLRKSIDGVREHNNFLPLTKKDAWKCRICTYQQNGTCKAGQFNVNQSDKKKNRMIGTPYDYN